jgi:hypothetical protein
MQHADSQHKFEKIENNKSLAKTKTLALQLKHVPLISSAVTKHVTYALL